MKPLLLVLGVLLASACGHDESGIETWTAAWRYQAGDNPRWADPEFDDAEWTLVNPDEAQFGSDIGNYGWYRTALTWPRARCEQVNCAIMLGAIQGADEVYINGHRVGASGQMGVRSGEVLTAERIIRVYSVPVSVVRASGPQVVAIRAQHYFGQPLQIIGPMHVAQQHVLQQHKRRAERIAYLSEMVGLCCCVLTTLGALLLLMSTSAVRREYVYLAAFGLVSAGSAWLDGIYLVNAGTQAVWERNLSLLLAIPVALLFYRAVHPVLVWRWDRWEWPVWGLVSVGMGAALLVPNGSSSGMLYGGALVVYSIGIGLTLYSIARTIQAGYAELWPVLAGGVVVLLTFALPYVVHIGPHVFSPFNVGFVLFVFGMGSGALWYYSKAAQRRELLAVQAEHLQALDAMKSRFFANISHEFRTPLTLIQAPLHEVLEERLGSIPENAKAQLRTSQRNAERLQRLIDEVLELARLESGKLILRGQPHDLGDFVQRVASAFDSLATQRAITLSVAVPTVPLRAVFDADKLEHVLTNLIANAFQFTKTGGRIAVRCVAEDGAWMAVEVEDTGAGIAPDALPHVFDRFYQADECSQRIGVGSGVGLALVKEVVERHGGEVAVASTLGEGTTFTVRLQTGHAHLADEDLVSNQPAEEAAVQATLTDEEALTVDPTRADEHVATVLLVEDHPDLRAYLDRHFAQHYQVRLAENGAEGWASAQAHPPDLIISDVMMPEMDGLALLRCVKSDAAMAATPVILLTAKADVESRLEGLHAQADDYIAKPFHIDEVLARAHNQLAMRQRWQQTVVAVDAAQLDLDDADQRFLAEVQQAIEAQLQRADFSVQDLADAVHLGRRTLERRLKAVTGHPPSTYIRQVRLARAQQLLTQRIYPTVAEVAAAVGFADAEHFAKRYQTHYGVRPSEHLRTPLALSLIHI